MEVELREDPELEALKREVKVAARALFNLAKRLGDTNTAELIRYLRRLRPVSPDSVVTVVAAAFRVPLSALRSQKRGSDHVAFARHVAIHLLYDLTGMSYPQIGAFFSRDHSSTIHGDQVVKRRIDSDPAFGKMLEKIKVRLMADVSPFEPGTAQPPADDRQAELDLISKRVSEYQSRFGRRVDAA
jgi:chromosomal replication initiation ATPase DnaA